MNICRVSTVPFIFIHHINSQIKATRDAGNTISLVSSSTSGFDDGGVKLLEELADSFHPIEIHRRISPMADIRAIYQLYRYFKLMKFDIVHSITSKAGLLSAIAAKAAGIPVRMHTFVGQPWTELSGPIRWISIFCDWLIARLNTQCYADSLSQAELLVQHHVVRSGQLKVLGSGSVAGVNLKKFDAEAFDKNDVRKSLNIKESTVVLIYVGRVTKDKGIDELVSAFSNLKKQGYSDLLLLLVGPLELNANGLDENTLENIKSNIDIKSVGYVDNPEKYLVASDLFCIPSYREGFGTVVIEAAAMGIPSVATRVVGLVDAVIDGETGILVPSKDVDALVTGIKQFLDNPELMKAMGYTARTRAKRQYSSEYVNQLMVDEYNSQFNSRS
jgi:glycosyltransferase involved in cell wall biosynthesis